MKNRVLPSSLILRGPVALGKEIREWAKKFPNTQQISFFCVAVAVVYEKLCKSSIHLKVINCFALSRFLSADQRSRRMSVLL